MKSSITPELLPLEFLHTSHLEQGALSQLHRWLSLFANGKTVSRLCADALCSDVSVSFEGTTLTDSLEDALALSSADFGKALHIQGSRQPVVTSAPGEPLILEVELALAESGDHCSHRLQARFAAFGGIDAKIAAIIYAKSSEAKRPTFKPCASRILSVNHRWHALVEDPQRTPEPFREIVSDNFLMEYGHGAVRSFEELSKWVGGSASSVAAARHDLLSFHAKSLESGRARAVFVLDWQGLSHDQKRMIAKTKHSWIVLDEPKSRFPQIEHVEVEFLTPFTTLAD